MLRWAIISIITAAAFLTAELALLKTVYGKDKDSGRGRSSDSGGRSSGGGGGASSRSFSGGGGGGRSFSGGSGSGSKSDTRSFDSRSSQPRSFDSGNSDSKRSRSIDSSPRTQPRVQSPPKTVIENFQRPMGDNKQFKFDKPKDTPRVDAPRTTDNDRAADRIRKAQENAGRGKKSSKPTGDVQIEPRKRSDSKFDSPSFTRDNKKVDADDRFKLPAELDRDSVQKDNAKQDNRFDRLPKETRDALDRSKLSKDAKDARDRDPVKRDLKLGDVDRDNFKKDIKDKPGDADGDRSKVDRDRVTKDKDKVDDKLGDKRLPKDFDRDKLDGKLPKDFARGEASERPKNFERKRALEDKLGIDKSKREKYDLVHHGIKHDGKLDDVTAARLAKKSWIEKGDRDHFDKLASSAKYKSYRLGDQYRYHDRGDVARRLALHDDFARRGGWQHRHVGHVSARYRNHAAFRSYWGPSWYPRRCWYPVWNPWVSWSWGFRCDPWFDPRPVFCRPVFYDPCPRWVVWQYPVWQPLPFVAAGTWVDVPEIVVEQGWDVQLLATRFVDPGHFEQNLGPRYRVWLRNNSRTDIDKPFDVVLMGVDGLIPNDRRLEVGQRVPSLAAGQTMAIDLRLPLTPDGRAGEPIEFSNVHVLVDANRELRDIELTNNGAVIDRGDILPVDPATFNADSDIVEPGMVINIAGEGLGPEPGQVMLQVGNETYQPEILGWYDLGVQIRVPEVAAAVQAAGDLVIIRGDGAAANPLTLQIAGAEIAGRAF